MAMGQRSRGPQVVAPGTSDGNRDDASGEEEPDHRMQKLDTYANSCENYNKDDRGELLQCQHTDGNAATMTSSRTTARVWEGALLIGRRAPAVPRRDAVPRTIPVSHSRG